jgi:hypothetical protein
LNTKKTEIVKSYIPDRFLNDAFWMETGAIEHNGEIFLLGYFVSFKSDAEYSAKPLNLICKINKARTELTYKILDYSTTAFNFFEKDDEGNFYTFRGADEIIKFNANLDIIYQKKLTSDNSNIFIYYAYNYQNALFWAGSTQKAGGLKPLIIKTDLDGNKIWEVVLDGNISYGVPPLIILKTPALYLVFSGQANKIYASEIRDNSVGVKEGEITQTQISPNPASDYIELIPPLEKRGLGGVLQPIEIFDIFGELVLSVEIQNFVSQQRIDITSLQTGVYFLKLNNQPPMKFIKL